MNNRRTYFSIVVCSLAGGALSWLIPGMDTGSGIATGVAVGIAVGAAIAAEGDRGLCGRIRTRAKHSHQPEVVEPTAERPSD